MACGKSHKQPVFNDLKNRERVKGIEPSYAAWEAAVLPLNYTREKINPTNLPVVWSLLRHSKRPLFCEG